MKVVINTCFGGFGLSPEAILWLDNKGAVKRYPIKEYYGSRSIEPDLKEWRKYKKLYIDNVHLFSEDEAREEPLHVFTEDEKYVLSYYEIERNDPLLVEVVELMGEKANGSYSELKVVEIPDDAKYEIDEYDGNEHIAEVHRTWS